MTLCAGNVNVTVHHSDTTVRVHHGDVYMTVCRVHVVLAVGPEDTDMIPVSQRCRCCDLSWEFCCSTACGDVTIVSHVDKAVT